MKKVISALVLALNALTFAMFAPANAQDSQQSVWIQLAARSSLQEATNEAQSIAARLPDVVGYSLGGGWYGVLIGPYTREDAERVLQVYRNERQIPRDSFIAFSANLRNQFYPIGATGQAAVQSPLQSAQAEPTVVAPEPETTLPDETPAQARRSEQLLSGDEKKDLQIALKAAGFYTAAIDGSFGRGTRSSMSDWQLSKGFEPTGVLTTAQRKVLMDDYNAPLISVGMARVADTKAGVALQIPTKEVTFDRHEPPFAHFKSTGSLGAQVLLISQKGDRNTLYGLYDIMQTLEIVPLDGPRERQGNGFTLEGRDGKIVSYTEASLKNGAIKGFTLIWPAGDDDRRARVLAEMKASFERLDGILEPTAGANIQQNIDLVSGLEIRKPRLSRSGFFVTKSGAVLTTSEAVAACSRVTLDHGYQAQIALNDPKTGLAILSPVETLAPMAVAGLSTQSPRLNSEIAVSGFSYEGVLGAPSLTWGALADVKNLDGNPAVARLKLTPQPGDAGGPVLDNSGSVIGMLLAAPNSGKQLPEDVSFAANAQAIRDALTSAGLSGQESAASQEAMSPQALVRHASGMTVLVNCWD